MGASVNVIRLSEDASGESHFDGFEIERLLSHFAPPARPFHASSVESAAGYVVISIPAGWVGELHRSPHRQILFCLSGALKITASDGDVRVVEAGGAWLMTDTRGKGHKGEVASGRPFEAVIILLGNSN